MTLVKRTPSDDHKFLLFIGNLAGWHKVHDVDIITLSLSSFVNEKLSEILTPVDIQQPSNPVLGCGSCPLKSQYIRRYGRDH